MEQGMADNKEKRLLNEITYLTRLIGQHKKNQVSLIHKWSNSTGFSTSFNRKHHSLYKSVSKSTVPIIPTSSQNTRTEIKNRFSPYVKVSPAHFKRAEIENNKEKLNVLVNRSIDRVDNAKVNPILSNHMPSQKTLKVHVNPNFCDQRDSQPVNVHINPKFKPIPIVDPKSELKVNCADKNPSTPEKKLKVHMNPKFCDLLPANSPHTQLRTLMSNKVHVNPKLVELVLNEKNEAVNSRSNGLKSTTNTIGQQSSVGPVCNSMINQRESPKPTVKKPIENTFGLKLTTKKSEFVSLGKRKLVRIGHGTSKSGSELGSKEKSKPRRISTSSMKQKRPIISPPFKKVKSSKYKLVKVHTGSQALSRNAVVSTKYRIDRRTTDMKNGSQNPIVRNIYKDISSLRSKRSIKSPQRVDQFIALSRTSNGNLVWRRAWNLQAKKFITSNTKLYRIGSSPVIKKNNDSSIPKNINSCNSSLVRIGGVLYKSSRNKLTRQNSGNSEDKRAKPAVGVKRRVKTVPRSQVLHIRGQKFVMDSQGKTLKRLSTDSEKEGQTMLFSPSLKRVDIGGVTFVEKSSDVFTRTDYHKARSLLSYAKQKSIATLMKKLKKNNQPCMFYQKFGRCLRMEKGTCPCVHDRKHVAVCMRFLQGRCNIVGCLLSHDVGPEKMPTCKYFLEGCCNRIGCPYLHVKLNSKVDICTNFLQGYCSSGQKCKKRHIRICPDFEKKGKCLKGKKCPYPHVKGRMRRNSLKRKVPPKIQTVVHEITKPRSKYKKVVTQPNLKAELRRYYLAPEETSGNSSKGGTVIEQKSTITEHVEGVNIPYKPEVSAACDSVENSGEMTFQISERKNQREKLGTLPAFIPL